MLTDSQWQEFRAGCNFMQPVIEQSEYFSVETSIGTEIIPADLIGLENCTDGELREYLEGAPVSPNGVAYRISGYVARMTAPGYMACTEWRAFDTEQNAREYLVSIYGEE